MQMRQWIVVAALVFVPSVVLAKGFDGSYASGPMGLTLAQTGDVITGTLVIDGKNFPISGRNVKGNLVGYYTKGKENVPFMAMHKGEALELQLDGVEHVFDRAAPSAKPTLNADRQGAAHKLKAPRAQKGTVKDDAMGVRFKVPSGWEARRSKEGMVLASPKNAGFVLVFAHDATTLNELEETADEGLVIGGQSFLKLVNKAVPLSKTTLGVKLSGKLEGKSTKGYGVAIMAKGGGGVVVLGLTEASAWDEGFEKLIGGIAKSVKFAGGKAPKSIKSWKKELAESTVEHLEFERSSGFGATGNNADSMRMTFCKDGSFARERASSTSAAAWARGGATQTLEVDDEREFGAWDVVEADGRATLHLALPDGTEAAYPLAWENKKLFLNGMPYGWAKASCK